MDEIAGLAFGVTLAAVITIFVTMELYRAAREVNSVIREMEEREWK